MLSQSRYSRLRPVAMASLVAFVLAAAPAQAERWQELPYKKGATYRIDLDSLHWDGRVVKYRVEITLNQNGLPHRVISTGLINCETGQRKTIQIDYPLPDGSTRKELRDDRWRTIERWFAAENCGGSCVSLMKPVEH